MSKPIPVRLMQFAAPQDGPGLSAASSCTAVDSAGRKTRHEIEFHPWLRHFLVTYRPPDGKPIQRFIHEGRIMNWEPLNIDEYLGSLRESPKRG